MTDRYANNTIETGHGRVKARLRPMRALRRHRSAQTIAAGHAFVQNLRRGHFDIATGHHPNQRLQAAFTELAASRQPTEARAPVSMKNTACTSNATKPVLDAHLHPVRVLRLPEVGAAVVSGGSA